MAFAPNEADAIMLGLGFVMQRGDAELQDGARNAMAKIAGVMPSDAAHQARCNGLVAGPARSTHNDAIAAIRSAIRSWRKLTFVYTNAEERTSSRIVWPVALGFFDNLEMVAAWCEARGAFRHFRLDRMRDARVTDHRIPLGSNQLMSR